MRNIGRGMCILLLIMSILFTWSFAFAYPTLPEAWKIKFENWEVVNEPELGNNLADGVEDNWGIAKITSIIDRSTTTSTWADLATERYEISAIFYNLDFDDAFMEGSNLTVNASNKLLTGKLDLWIDDKLDAGYTVFDPSLGPGGRLLTSTYTGVTDGVMLASFDFVSGILVDADADSVDTIVQTITNGQGVSFFTGDGSGFMEVIDGTGYWADIILREVMPTNNTTNPMADAFFEFDTRVHPDSGMDDWGWDTNSEDPAFGHAIPEPATMLLLGSGLIGLAGFGRKKRFFKKD